MKENNSIIKAAGGILWKKSGSKKAIAIIHRKRYDDWSLPKGKLHPGETWQEAALREVGEETGCRGAIVQYAGSFTYILEDRPKVVQIWHMDVVKHEQALMNGEVDQIRWLTVDEAVQLIDYEDEKELLLNATRGPDRGH